MTRAVLVHDPSVPELALDPGATERLVAALDRDPVVSVAVFGSRGRGTARRDSDLDLAVWLDPAVVVQERFACGLRLGSRAAQAVGGKVDLVVLNDAPLLLRHRAHRDGVRVLERDPRLRIRLESQALIAFLDTQPLRDELDRGLRNRLAEGRFGRR